MKSTPGLATPDAIPNLMCMDRAYDRFWGRHPCRTPEERSCNMVGAVCAQPLKYETVKPEPTGYDSYRLRLGKKCNIQDNDPEGEEKYFCGGKGRN